MEKADCKIDLEFDAGLVGAMRSAFSDRVLSFATLVLASSIASACGGVSSADNLETPAIDPRVINSARVTGKSRECILGQKSGYDECRANAIKCDERGGDDCFSQLDSCSRPLGEALDSCLDEYSSLLTCNLDDELGNKHDPLGHADPDMDGLDAFTEFLAGTDPCNAVSDGKIPDGDRDHDSDGVPNRMDQDIGPCSSFGGIGSSGCG